MKYIIFGFSLILSLSTTVASGPASAHQIEGVQILKGTLKTKIVVNKVKTTCKVKIVKVKNLMLEDSHGNPAYTVRTEISLDGSDFERSLSVKHSNEVWFNNLFAVGKNTEVRDLEYASEDGSKMTIDRDGRIKSITFPFKIQKVFCSF